MRAGCCTAGVIFEFLSPRPLQMTLPNSLPDNAVATRRREHHVRCVQRASQSAADSHSDFFGGNEEGDRKKRASSWAAAALRPPRAPCQEKRQWVSEKWLRRPWERAGGRADGPANALRSIIIIVIFSFFLSLSRAPVRPLL